VVLAVGETVDLDFARASGLTLKENGTIDVDRLLARNQPHQVLRRRRPDQRRIQRPNAMGYGKSARNIDERLMGARRFDQIYREFDYEQVAGAAEREPPPCLRRTCAARSA
jgi:hypothetical protein